MMLARRPSSSTSARFATSSSKSPVSSSRRTRANPVGPVGVEQLVREAADYCELAIPARRLLFRIGRGRGSRSRAGRDRASCGRCDERQGCEQDAEQGNQRIAGRRLLRDQRLDAQDRRASPTDGKTSAVANPISSAWPRSRHSAGATAKPTAR